MSWVTLSGCKCVGLTSHLKVTNDIERDGAAHGCSYNPSFQSNKPKACTALHVCGQFGAISPPPTAEIPNFGIFGEGLVPQSPCTEQSVFECVDRRVHNVHVQNKAFFQVCGQKGAKIFVRSSLEGQAHPWPSVSKKQEA